MRKPGKMFAEVMRSMVKKPATVLYPFVSVKMPPKFRGKLKFTAPLCIGCKICMRDCPSAAINIRKVGEKQFEADIDLSKCIYCAQCVDSCPKKALASTEEFELAQLNRASLRETQRGPRPATAETPAEPAAKPEENAQSHNHPEKKA
jgi:formate hydrogenlyase subunit 6/NADH:ubiquinone oxidoreductase subunit I